MITAQRGALGACPHSNAVAGARSGWGGARLDGVGAGVAVLEVLRALLFQERLRVGRAGVADVRAEGGHGVCRDELAGFYVDLKLAHFENVLEHGARRVRAREREEVVGRGEVLDGARGAGAVEGAEEGEVGGGGGRWRGVRPGHHGGAHGGRAHGGEALEEALLHVPR